MKTSIQFESIFSGDSSCGYKLNKLKIRSSERLNLDENSRLVFRPDNGIRAKGSDLQFAETFVPNEIAANGLALEMKGGQDNNDDQEDREVVTVRGDDANKRTATAHSYS